jgi:YD repeat-containing protein
LCRDRDRHGDGLAPAVTQVTTPVGVTCMSYDIAGNVVRTQDPGGGVCDANPDRGQLLRRALGDHGARQRQLDGEFQLHHVAGAGGT